MKDAVLAAIIVLMASQAGAQIYRCDVDGKVNFTDEPCVGAKRVEVTPTQGLDKWSGTSRKGQDVQRSERNRQLDQALRPLTGKSHEEMNVSRRRFANHLTAEEHAECKILDISLAQLERRESRATGDELKAVQADLLRDRRRFRELKC